LITVAIVGPRDARAIIAAHLAERHGFYHSSGKRILVEELDRQGLPLTKTNLQKVGSEVREKHGQDYIVQMAYEEALSSNKNAVLEGLKTPEELLFLQSRPNFFLVVVGVGKFAARANYFLKGDEDIETLHRRIDLFAKTHLGLRKTKD
jgi:hypothetical protein